MSATLADGRLTADAGALWTGNGVSSPVNATFHNTSDTATETLLLALLRVGSVARIIFHPVLGPHETFVLTGQPLSPGDVLQGQASDADTVDCTVTAGTGAFGVATYDANGALKHGASASGAAHAAAAGHREPTAGAHAHVLGDVHVGSDLHATSKSGPRKLALKPLSEEPAPRT